LFDGGLEGRQRLIPELVQVDAKSGDAVRVELVDAACAGCSIDDQPGVLEHFEVLRDRRSADRQLPRQIADGPGVIAEAFEDRSPRRITEGRQSAYIVSHH